MDIRKYLEKNKTTNQITTNQITTNQITTNTKTSNNKQNNYYVIKKGYKTGIFDSWSETQKHISGYSKPEYKKFKNYDEAYNYLNNINNNNNDNINENTSNIREKYIQTSEFVIDIFTDGSCINNGKNVEKRCGYGIYVPKYQEYNVSSRFTIEPLTNNRAELFAIYKSLGIIQKIDPLAEKQFVLYTDSEYSIKIYNNIQLFLKKNNNNIENLKNQDIIKLIIQKLNNFKHKLKIKHIYSHQENNNYFSISNNIVDKMAKNFKN